MSLTTLSINPKIIISDYYDSLARLIDIYTQELLEKYEYEDEANDESRLVNVNNNCLHFFQPFNQVEVKPVTSEENNETVEEKFGIEWYDDPYKEVFNNHFSGLEQFGDGDDSVVDNKQDGDNNNNNDHESSDLEESLPTMGIRERVHATRLQLIDELRRAERASRERYVQKKQTIDIYIDSLALCDRELPEADDELRSLLFLPTYWFLLRVEHVDGLVDKPNFFRLFVVSLDFYLNSSIMELLREFMGDKLQRDAVNNRRKSEREKSINFNEECFLAHLIKTFILKSVSRGRQAVPYQIIRIRKSELLSIQKVTFSYLQFGTACLEACNYFDLGFLKSLNISQSVPHYLKEEKTYLETLRALTSLEYLTTRNLSINNTSFEYLGQLRKLVIYNADFADFNSDSFDHLPNLSILEIHRPKNYTHIRLWRLTSLVWLKLVGIETLDIVGDLGADLAVIKIHNSSIDVESIHSFLRTRRSCTLEALDWSHNDLNWLNGRSLSSVRNLRHLRLKKNSMQVVDLNFEHLASLESLDLSTNDIESLEGCLPPKMASLRLLDLSNNSRLKISSGFFRGFSSLECLRVNNIDKINITKEFFRGLAQLTSLELAGNEIVYVDADAFVHTPSLRELNLAGCSIKLNAKTFYNLPNLKSLVLSNACLKSLDDDVFWMLKSLESLDLSNNDLDELHPNLFVGLNSLVRLDLSKNQVNTIDLDMFKSMIGLKELNLADNPIVENNQLIIEYFDELKIKLIVEFDD